MSSGTIVQFPLEDEYKKDTGITPEEINKLREWMKTQPHLPEEYITDLDLILIHHCYDRDFEKSKQLIDTHYTMKTNLTMLFKDRVFDAKIERVLNTMLLQPLPARTKDGYAIYYSRLIDSNPQNFVHVDSIRAIAMSFDIWQYEQGTWPGLIMVNDFSGLSFGHFYRMQFSAQHQLLNFLQEAFLAKLKQVHVLNAPAYFDRLLAIMKPFMKKALLDMIHIHRVGATDLEQYFPIEALPLEAGGSWKSVEECKEEVLAKFKASKEFFELESKQRVDETKRPDKPKTNAGFFGSLF